MDDKLRTELADVTAARVEGPAGKQWAALEQQLVTRCRRALHRQVPNSDRDLVDLAVADAVVWARDVAVYGNQWDPELGSGLGASVARRAELRLRHHRRGHRRAKRRSPVVDDSATVDDIADAADTAVGAICRLTWAETSSVEVVEAALAEATAAGWTISEAAEALNLSERGAATRLWRARRRWNTQHSIN